MLETRNTRIDIEALERRVKWDAQKYRWIWQDKRSPSAIDIPPALKERDVAEESTLAAESLANVEAPHYTLQRFPLPVRWIAAIAAKGVLYLGSIITHAQTRFNYHVVHGLSLLDRRFSQSREDITAIEGVITSLEEVCQRLDQQGDSLGRRLNSLEQRLDQHDQRLARADKERFDHGQELESIRSRLPSVEEEVRNNLPLLRESLSACKSGLAQHSARISAQERQLAQLKPQPSATGVEAAETRDRSVATSSGELGGIYMAFEDQFRGSPGDIVERLEEYLPLVDECLEGRVEDAIAIDLGCGRGEWLRLLSARGVNARGVDTSPGFIGQCLQAGLDVIEQEALAYLGELDDDSIDLVTGFHIIEHMDFERMVRLVDESRRVLRQGGMVIFETPNPKNLIVGACNFYADPTHVRQVFPELLEFVLQGRGFQSVALRYLNPHPEAQQLSKEEAPILAEQLNNLLSCARDFAVIGYK